MNCGSIIGGTFQKVAAVRFGGSMVEDFVFIPFKGFNQGCNMTTVGGLSTAPAQSEF